MLRRLLHLPTPFVLLCLARAVSVQAQDDAASGLFTEARHLPLVAQSATIDASPGEAHLHLVQVFFNDGEELGQADYRLHLPQDAIVLGHGFWSDGRFLAAELKEKEDAERAHAKAASEGRASTLLQREGSVHSFSVFPVGAGQQVKVELDIQLPVERALGRSALRVPVDSFLGQSPATTNLVARIASDGPLADWSVEGAKAFELERGERSVALAATSASPIEIAWSEEGAPLAVSVQGVAIPEGGLAVELRVLLNDAKEWSATPDEIVLVVDASHSMERRLGALDALFERLASNAPAPVRVVWTAERRVEADLSEGLAPLEERRAGFATSWAELESAARDAGCEATGRRCAIVTDGQVSGLSEADAKGPTILVLADANELAHRGDTLPERATAYQPGVEPEARLLALADELALATFQLDALMQDGVAVEWPGRQPSRVAEGGLLRLFGHLEGWSDLELVGEIAGRPVRREVGLVTHGWESPPAEPIRRGYYRERLAEMFSAWRKSSDDALKKQIVELSLREKIPTAFTSLQVDDPRLSMHAIKPGDPLLSVSAEPGLVDVVAWYPFGESRRLSRDEEGDWHDRFLVPRDWEERSYRIDVFKRFQDGRVERAHAWYKLDDSGPDASISHDEEKGLIVVDTGEATGEISSVILHGLEDEHALSPSGRLWSIEDSLVGPAAYLVVRDKAGNQSWFVLGWHENGELYVTTDFEECRRDWTGSLRRPRAVTPPLRAAGRGPLRREADALVLELDDLRVELPAAAAPLSSLDVTAMASAGDELLLGNAAGELLHLRRSGTRWEPTRDSLPAHRITGIAPLGDGRFLVGILGAGLWEWRDGALHGSALRTGTKFVTSVLEHEGEVFVGTAYRGLWRLTRRGVVRTRFEHDHVLALESTPAGLQVISGFGRFERVGRDRFRFVDVLRSEVERGAERLTSSATFDGATLVGSFDRGLLRLVGDELVRLDIGLGVLGSQVDDLAVFDGELWLATQGGLYSWSGGSLADAQRVHEAAVHDLHSTGELLFAATKRGLLEFRRGEDRGPRRLDDQDTLATSFFAVTSWKGEVWAGGMEGLYRLGTDGLRQVGAGAGFRAGWVTSLLPDGERLLVGTYADGVWLAEHDRVAPALGLEELWVPPNGLHRADGAVFIGGLGRSAHRWDDEGLVELRLPASDVHAVAQSPSGRLLYLTSAGLLLPEN